MNFESIAKNKKVETIEHDPSYGDFYVNLNQGWYLWGLPYFTATSIKEAKAKLRICEKAKIIIKN